VNFDAGWAVAIFDAVGTWITLVAVFVFARVLLHNQHRGFKHLDRLHKAVLHLESQVEKPQPRYLVEPNGKELSR